MAAIGHRASVVLHGEVRSRAARVPAEASIVGQILTQLGTEGGVGGLQVAAPAEWRRPGRCRQVVVEEDMQPGWLPSVMLILAQRVVYNNL